MGHIGYTPQFSKKFRIMGRSSNEIKKLLKEKNFLDEILKKGHQKADSIAAEKLKKIQEIVGF